MRCLVLFFMGSLLCMCLEPCHNGGQPEIRDEHICCDALLPTIIQDMPEIVKAESYGPALAKSDGVGYTKDTIAIDERRKRYGRI